MISRRRFDAVREEYGHYASWAVWGAEAKNPKDGMGDISFFDDPSAEFLATLDPDTVLVALNISRPVERSFGNFHPDYPEAQDYKLRYALREPARAGRRRGRGRRAVRRRGRDGRTAGGRCAGALRRKCRGQKNGSKNTEKQNKQFQIRESME